MLKKISQILFLSLSLCLRPDCALASGNSVNNPNEIMLSTLLANHQDIKSGSSAIELIDRQGKNLLNDTYNFINNPKNKKLLESQSGKELLKQQAILANYIAVKDHLYRCVKNKNDPRNLMNRILNTALSTSNKLNDLEAPCYAPTYSVKNYFDFNNQVMKVMKFRVSGDFLQEMNKKVLTNSLKSLLALKYKFDKNFMKSGVLSPFELDNLVKEICVKNSCGKISNQFMTQIQTEAIDYSKKIKSEEKRFDKTEATNSLNASIDRLNNSLEKIAVKKDEGIIFDSANLNDPNTKKQFDQYIFNYMNEVSKDAGPILLTRTLREASGEIKNLTDDEVKKSKQSGQFKFTPHKHINESQFSKALEEAHDKIIAQASDTEKIISNEKARQIAKKNIYEYPRQDDIDELVKINPLAAGQILIHSPEYAGLVCDSINRISQKSNDKAQFDKYFMGGSAILGGALLLTGVGTVAGAYILTGSLSAGLAAGTVGSTIMATTVVAGAISEASMGAYMGIKAYDANYEMNQIEKALLSHNTDSSAMIENRDAYISFKEARMKSMLSLASAGFSAIGLDKFYSLTKFAAPTFSMGEFKATTKIMEYLSENATTQKLAQTAKLIGSKGSDLIDQFLLHLAKTSEKIRLATLDLLKDTKITPQKIKEIFEEALEAAKKCSK